MIKRFFTADLYVKVKTNKFEAKNLTSSGNWETIVPDKPFTTERLLVGTFTAAEPTLCKLVNSILPRSLIKIAPRILIQPMEKIDGGLSEVEERIFRELAFGAGAFWVLLHTGLELSDSEASKLIRSI